MGCAVPQDFNSYYQNRLKQDPNAQMLKEPSLNATPTQQSEKLVSNSNYSKLDLGPSSLKKESSDSLQPNLTIPMNKQQVGNKLSLKISQEILKIQKQVDPVEQQKTADLSINYQEKKEDNSQSLKLKDIVDRDDLNFTSEKIHLTKAVSEIQHDPVEVKPIRKKKVKLQKKFLIVD